MARHVDRRNPGLSEFASSEIEEPFVEVGTYAGWKARPIEASAPIPSFWISSPEVTGYTARFGDQPCLVEVWIEKSTMNDELLPVCSWLGVNLVTSIGFQSITAMVDLVKRAVDSGKPARVLFIADHDPAGDGMAIAVARQAQYRIEQQLGIDLDLTIEELMLTPAQVQKYRLPRVPIKEKDRRRQGFEDRHGHGAVELDALEALHPGEFAKIVRKAINRYRDSSLWDRTANAYAEAKAIVTDEWHALTAPFRKELRELEYTARTIYDQYQERLAEISVEMQSDLEPINQRLQELAEEFERQAERFNPEIPSKPYAVPDGPPASDPLFDSTRRHLEQLMVFRRHKT